jgi:hypothetical protein
MKISKIIIFSLILIYCKKTELINNNNNIYFEISKSNLLSNKGVNCDIKYNYYEDYFVYNIDDSYYTLYPLIEFKYITDNFKNPYMQVNINLIGKILDSIIFNIDQNNIFDNNIVKFNYNINLAFNFGTHLEPNIQCCDSLISKLIIKDFKNNIIYISKNRCYINHNIIPF